MDSKFYDNAWNIVWIVDTMMINLLDYHLISSSVIIVRLCEETTNYSAVW